jgi:hypothetical protein
MQQAVWEFSVMPNTTKDLLLPTEMAGFLRACGKYNLRINAFQVTFHLRPSPFAAGTSEQLVRIRYKRSKIEKEYTRHVAPTWTTLFDLDLLSGHFDLHCESLAAQLTWTSASSQVARTRASAWQGHQAGA